MTLLILGSLLTIGLILVLLEILFVPGTTLVGLLGVLVTAAGIYYAFITLENQTASLILGVTILVNFTALFYGFKSGVWKKFALKETLSSRTFDDRLLGLTLGLEGKAISDIKPIGKAEFLDKIYEVKSEMGLIPVGKTIFIHKLENNKIIVKS
jgi:membrane-bound ClpP family serine protease